MGMFNGTIDSIREYLQEKDGRGLIRTFYSDQSAMWPERESIVLKEEVGVELGNPDRASLSFSLWLEEKGKVRDGTLSIIGPELDESMGKSLPFACVFIIEGHGFNEENSYQRYRELKELLYDTHPEGYMLRALPQRQRIWCRVSKEAIDRGFSLYILGNIMLNKLKEKAYIDKAEVLFVTSSDEDVNELEETSQRVIRTVAAMFKMSEALSLDCDECDYADVCREVVELRTIRRKLRRG